MNDCCSMIEDLLPLYAADACSEESRTAIESHLATCTSCRSKLERMNTETVSEAAMKASGAQAAKVYAKKVKRHRIKVFIGVSALAFFSACILALVFLTVRDMRLDANPTVYPVADGVYNLTANPLQLSASEADEYVLFTNYTKIEVSAAPDADNAGELILWNVDDRENPLPVQYGQLTPENTSCTFGGLTSACLYRITFDGSEDLVLTVTDGRHVSFGRSFLRVLNEVFSMITGS